MTQIARGSGDRWTTRDAELSRQVRRAGGRAPTEPWGDSAFDIADWRSFRASVLLVAGDLPEARDEANMALRIPEIGGVARARALSVRGTAKVLMSGHAEGIADLHKSLEHIGSVGAHNTTLHAGVLTNLAMIYGSSRDRRARRTLAKAAKARAAAAASDADWAREIECLEAFNAVLARRTQLRAEELVEQLSAIARTRACC